MKKKATLLKCIFILSWLFASLFASSAFALSRPAFPVIFIHGIASDANSAWGLFTDFLLNQGWIFGGDPTFDPTTGKVSGIIQRPGGSYFYTMNFSDYNLPLPSQYLTFELQGMQLGEVIKAVLAENPGFSQVILVAHSMGGLASRAYLQSIGVNRYAKDVAKLITIGTPHQGTKLAEMVAAHPDLFALSPLHIDGSSEAVKELKPGSEALATLNNVGLNPLRPEIRYLSIIGTGTTVIDSSDDGDGIVTATSQDLSRAVDTSGLPHESLSAFILDRSDCDPSLFIPLVPNETHTCETSDQGVWAELLQQIPRFSVNWIATPPSSIVSGNSFTVSWQVTDGRTFGHTNVHFDTIPDLNPDICLLRSSCQSTSFQQGANTTFSAIVTAPTVNSQTTYFFAVHAEIDGFDALSSVIPVVVSPSTIAHTLTITNNPSGNPNPVAPGSTVNMSAAAADSLNHVLSYFWTASCPSVIASNGSFNSANIRTPIWTAPANTTGSLQNCTIQVTVSDGQGLSELRSYTQGISAAPSNHTLTITSGPSGNPNPLIPGGSANLTVTATDSLGHTLNYSWTVACPTLSSNGTLIGTVTQSPTWIAPLNSTGIQQSCTIQVTVSDGQGVSQVKSYSHGVSPGGAASLSITDGIRFVEPPPYPLSGKATVDATIKNTGSAAVVLDRIQAIATFTDPFGFVFDREWPAEQFSPALTLAPGESRRYTKLLSDTFPGLASTATVMIYVKFNNIPGQQPITNFVSPATAQLAFIVGHSLDITNGPGGNPDPVPSGGTVNVTVNVTDSLRHVVNFSWTASCSGLPSNGTFNNATAQNPVWTAPLNETGSQQACTIRLNVNDGQGLTNVAQFIQRVDSIPHNITMLTGPSGNPNPAGSGSTVNVSASATDSLGHSLSYSWTASCPGLVSNGTFSNANVQNPAWTAPANLTGSLQNCSIMLTVSDGQGLSSLNSFQQGVSSREHILTITNGPNGNPNPVSSGSAVNLNVAGVDSLNHNLSYTWTASCPAVLASNGSFSNSNAQNPTWTAPANLTGSQQNCSIQVSVSDGQGLSQLSSYQQSVSFLQTSTLTVNKTGTGGGTITSSPAGIDCGFACQALFNSGTSVTLTPTAASGSVFSGWSGDSDCSDGIVTMDADKACTATFNLITPLVIGVSSLSSGEVRVPYQAPLNVSGGLPPYTVTVSSSALPAGLKLGSPTIIGTPTVAGSKRFTIKVTDQRGISVSKIFTLNILRALSISTTSLSIGVRGRSYSAILRATGGKTPYIWSLISGNLPTGLTLQAATGRITGIPTQTGVFNLTFRVADPLGGQAQKNLTLTIR